MKRFAISIVITFLLSTAALANCFVMDKTIYATNKDNLYRLSNALNDRNQAKVQELVNRGLVGMCTSADCVVLDNDGTLAHVRILGIGTVWTFSSFVICR